MLQNYIAGQWQAPAEQGAATVRDASTGEALFVQGMSSAAQVEAAIQVAAQQHAQNSWFQKPAAERAADLERIADEISARGPAIAEADARQTGVILALTQKFVLLCAGAFKQAAELVRNPPQTESKEGPHGPLAIERLPLGPAAIIAPWNAPAGIAAHKVASALAAGCPVILKPSEWAPSSGQLLVEAAAAAGLPAGMLQVLHGDGRTGAALCADQRVRAVSFTGGLEAGRAVARACAQDIKPAQLELGGNNALVVLADADIARAADGVVTALTTLNGQWCRALGRLLVHQDVEAELLAAVQERLAQLKIGPSMEAQSQMGPLVSEVHRQRVQQAVAELQAAGAEALQPSSVPTGPGCFYPPTLLKGLQPEQSCEEIFGPVAAVHTFADDAEAVRLGNQTPFGLAAYVFGAEDHAWAVASQLRAGLIKINAVTMLNLHPQAPRPAWGLSGLGDEGTLETFEFFRGTRVIGVAAR